MWRHLAGFNLGYAWRPEIIQQHGKSNCYTIVIEPRLHACVNLHFILVPDHIKYKKLASSVRNFTLLTRRSVWSKCRPYIFGASPGGESIFTQTSIPFLASVRGLWFASMPVTTPMSINWKRKKIYTNLQSRLRLFNHWHAGLTRIDTNAYVNLTEDY